MGNKIKLGVIGDPIDHSLSPLIHSQFGDELGINLDSKHYHVDDSELDNFIKNDSFQQSNKNDDNTVVVKIITSHKAKRK